MTTFVWKDRDPLRNYKVAIEFILKAINEGYSFQDFADQLDETTGVATTSDSVGNSIITLNFPELPSIIIQGTDYLDFDTTAEVEHKEGRVHWNSEDGTLEVGMPGGNVAIQLGQEQVLPNRPKNVSGDVISNGMCVYISGASGAVPEVDLANANNIDTAKMIAVATEDVASNQRGYYTTFGVVRDVDTSAFTEGDELYLSTTDGVITNVQQSYPNYNTRIGYCFRSHAEEGVIFVSIRNNFVDGDFFVNGRLYQFGTAAEIHVHENSTAQLIPTGISYTKLNCYADNGASMNATADAANDKITITHPGLYKVDGSFSFTSNIANREWRVTAFLGGVEQDQLHFTRKIGTAGDVGSASITGFIKVETVPQDLDARARHDNPADANITVSYSNLNVLYVGEIQ